MNTVDLLAVAQAAYRINGNALLKDTRNDLIANGVLVKAHLAGTTKLELIPDDTDQATAIKSYISQRVMLSRLIGKPLGDFVEQIGDLLEKEQVNKKNAGILAWAPKVYADMIKADDNSQDIARIATTSRYIGKVGDKVELEFHTIIKRWNANYNCYRYTGHDGKGNLIGFLCKNDYPAIIKLKARIKACEESRFTNGRTTYINYTKEIK